jgi:hypothetical protein
VEDSSKVVFKNVFSLLEYDRNKLFDRTIGKRTFTPIADPYATHLPYTGVSGKDWISVNDPHIQMCAWSIVQVYTRGQEHPGTALFPVNPGTGFISYFDEIPPGRAADGAGYIRLKIDGNFSCKAGVRPEDLVMGNPCKAIYLSPSAGDDDTWLCVVKRSDDIPHNQKECVDMTKNGPADAKAAVQVYNTDHGSKEDMIAFPCGELSLQLKKGTVQHGVTVSSGVHELLSYRGTKGELLELAKTILRLSATPELF